MLFSFFNRVDELVVEVSSSGDGDAINKLKGTENAAGAVVAAAQIDAAAIRAAAQQNAIGTMQAAKINAEGLVAATTINMHPENEMYDSVTGPLFGVTGHALSL